MSYTAQNNLAVKGERYRNTVEASKYLLDVWGIRLSPTTMNTQRSRGGGAKFRKAGSAVLYGESNLDEHALALIGAPVSSTSELHELRQQAAPEPHRELRHSLTREPVRA
jgi:hypothetical protein